MFFRPRTQPDPRSRRRRALFPRLEALEIRLAPAATQLVFTSQPATVVAGHTFGLTVSAEDASGTVDTTFDSNVSVSWQSDPFDSSTVAATDGVATFSGLTLTAAGPQYPQATGGGLTSALTDSIAVTAAAATQLVVISPPPAAVTAGVAFGLVIAAEDQYGNIDPALTGSVTVALASNPGGSTLTGSTNVNFSNGLAAFSGLTLDGSGSGYALVASSNGLAPPPWMTFDVSAAAATQLVVTSPPPGIVVAGGAFGFAVAASDPYGNVDPAFTGGVTVALAGNPGGSTLTGSTNVNFSNGLAIFAGLSLNKTGAGYTLQVSSNGLAPPSSFFTLNVSAATAAQLAVTVQPPATVTAGQIFPLPLTVAVEDAFGNTVTGFSGNLAIAPTSVAVEGSLGGSLTVPVIAGTASFTGLSLDKAGTGYTLQVSGTGLSAVTTSPFSVLAGPAAELVVTAQPPASVAAGTAFGLVVQVGDQYGNAVPSYTGGGSVTVALAGPPPGVALGGGTTTLSFSTGLATFAGLTLDTAGSGYSLEVSFQPGPSDNPLASATSSALTVTAAAATRLVVTSPPPAVVTAGGGFGLVIAAEDPFGNVVPSTTGNVTMALAGNPGGGALGGTSNASFSNGLATFAGLTLDTADSGYTLQVSSSGLAPPAPIAVDVSAAAATQLVVTAQPPASVAAGAPFGLTVAVEDAFGNTVEGFIGNLAVAPATGAAAGSLGGTLTVQVSGGTASFAGLILDKAGAAYTLQVTGTGLPAVSTSPFSVTPAPAAQLVVTTPPPASVAAASPFGLQVSAEDQYGNVDSALAGNVTVALVNNPGGSTLGGTTTASFASGVASFAGLTLSQPGAGYTLLAASNGLASPTPIALNVTAPVAAQLVVTSQPPAFIAAGGTFGLTVVVEDANGNPVTGFIGNLSVSPSNSAVEGSLGGSLTVPVIDAVATFAGLSLDKAGDGLTLQVSVGGLLAVTTNPFSVTVGTTAQLAVTVQPPASVAAGSGFGLQASAEDQYGNVVPTYGGSVTVALADNPTGGALGGTTTATFSNGTATFAGLTLTRAGTGYTLQVSGGGLISPTSSALTVTAAAATQLFVVSRPPAAVVAGSTFGLQISAQDPFGNVNSSVNGSVTVALAADPGGGALGGTTSVSFSNGLATFALTLDQAGIGYTLQAASSGLAPPAPIPLNVSPAAISQLVVISQPPATIFAGEGFGLTVAVEDAFGNTVTGFNGNLAIAPSSTVTGSLGGLLTASATAGLATFTGLTITTPGSALTLQVSGTGLSAVTTSPFSVTAAPAVQLVVTSQPPAYVTAGSGFGLVISAEDSSGNVDPTFNGNVTVALASNLGGSALGGTVTVAATGGVATFASLILSTASAGYELQATTGGLAPATTALIDALTPGTTAPTSGASGTVGYLAIHSQPTVVDAGTYFQLTVVVDNAQGATDTSFSGMVTLALAGNPGGATLGGNLTMPVSFGVLTYYGLTLNVPGSGYTIRVTGNGLALAVSSPIVVVNPPVRLVAIAPPPASVAANGSFGLTVAVVDASGNLAPGYNGPVTIALAGKRGKAKLRGALTVAAVHGVAMFSGLTLTNARRGQALQFQVTAGGLTSVTTNRLNVLAAAARIRPHRTRNKVAIHRA